MAPLIRFSEKSLHHPKFESQNERGGLRTPTAREGSMRAHTVCNFGIRAAVVGMVPTKPFFCRSLKGRSTPRRGRGGADCGPGQRRPALDGPTANGRTHRIVSSLRIEMVVGTVPVRRLSPRPLHSPIVRMRRRGGQRIARRGTESTASVASLARARQ